MIKYIFASLIALFLVSQAAHASNTDSGLGYQTGIYFSAFMGAPKSVNNQVSFNLEDQADQVFEAKYNNRPFQDSYYWSTKVEHWDNKEGMGLELIHHKIYLSNTNDVIEDFSLSDGYNLLYWNFGRQYDEHIVRLGLGVVIVNPDVTIAGRDRYSIRGGKGQHLAGPSVQLNYERWIWENETHFISLDHKLTLSYAVSPISNDEDEYVVAPDIAFHFSLGFGSKPEALQTDDGLSSLYYFAPLLYPVASYKTALGLGFPSSFRL